MKKEKVKQILEKLYQLRQDLQMLHDDVWVPDEDSCNASIENIENIIGEILKGEMVFVNSEGGLVAEVIKIQDTDVLVKFVGELPYKWRKYGYYKLNELQHAEYNQNDDKYYSKGGSTYQGGGIKPFDRKGNPTKKYVEYRKRNLQKLKDELDQMTYHADEWESKQEYLDYQKDLQGHIKEEEDFISKGGSTYAEGEEY